MKNHQSSYESNPDIELRSIVHQLNNVLTAMQCLHDLAESDGKTGDYVTQMRQLLAELKGISVRLRRLDSSDSAAS